MEDKFPTARGTGIFLKKSAFLIFCLVVFVWDFAAGSKISMCVPME
jgi:hypothetical protein